MTSHDPFEDGLRKTGNGIRRARTGFDAADEGFIQALEGLHAITAARGSLEETIAELKRLIVAQGQELQALRAEIAQLRDGQQP